ncbi:MAG: hypothetical protein R3Y13_04885 [bacterium]
MKKIKKMKNIIIILIMLLTVTTLNVNATTAEEIHICQSEVLITFRLIGYSIFVIKIIVPLIIIITSGIEIFKITISGETKDMGAATINFAKRFAAGAIIFFVPTIINLVLTAVSDAEDTKNSFIVCNNCVLEPNGSSCTTAINNLPDRVITVN